MASSLAETIATNFLNCSICFESYRDPRALPCQHGFCRECLEQCAQTSEDKRTIVCPICREEVKLSRKGVNKLPVHFLVSSLQDTVDMETTKTEEPSPDTACSNCKASGTKAKVRCVDCRKYLCETCYSYHTTFEAMKEHKIIPMEDILTRKVNFTKEEENRYCKVHGKLIEYYCEIEKKSLCRDCVVLNECPPEHTRISLKKASQNYTDELNDLLQGSGETLKKYEEAMMATNCVKKVLHINSQLGKEALKRAEQSCIDKVKKTFQKFEAEIDEINLKRVSELNQTEGNLQSTIGEIKLVTDLTKRTIQTESEFEIVSSHSDLSTKLQQLSISNEPQAADTALSYIRFEAAILEISTMGKVKEDGTPETEWKQTDQFSTEGFNKLCGLAVDTDDNIVLCSWDKGVKVYSRDGEVKCTLFDSPGAVDVAVSPDGTYHSIPVGKKHIRTNRKGRKFTTTPIKDVSNINSLTVDSDGKIIVGKVANTISIHNDDGSLISKFATHLCGPLRLAVTSNGEIVSSFIDNKLERPSSVQLMDYSGGNVRVVKPPVEVKVWYPGFVCCRQGEIFVCNEGSGDPSGVYRFTSEGDYLDCVTAQIHSPKGIALSKDGMELFVADRFDDHVKIFQRP